METGKPRELLESVDWNDIILKLTRHAIRRAERYTGRREEAIILPGGKSPADIALDAIEKVLTGGRSWDPDKYPNLLLHLEWIVNSDLQHLFSSSERQRSGRLPKSQSATDPETEAVRDPPNPLEAFPDSETPETHLLTKEEEGFEEETKIKLYSLLKGDEDLELLLLCLEEGKDKPALIAQETGWEISKVYNLKRKLLRTAAKVEGFFPSEIGMPKEKK